MSTEYRAELTAKLEALCGELAEEVGAKPSSCSIWDGDRVAACIYLRTRLKVTRGAMEKLDDMALRWLVAHELGHLTKLGRHTPWMRRLFAFGIVFFAELEANCRPPALALTVLFVGLVGAQALIRRPRERVADRIAHRCCASDPDAARRALTAVRLTSTAPRERLFRFLMALNGYPPFRERIAPAAD